MAWFTNCFSVFSILPPYNTIHAHVLHDGLLVTETNGLHVTFEAIADSNGSINTTSADKVNFWEHVADMFGAQPPNDVGLAGFAMPGTINVPQHMEFESTHNLFTGEGIPIPPFDDAAKPQLHPDNDKDIKLNILRLHDEKQLNNPDYFQALENQGFNTNGLYQTVVADGTAILCARWATPTLPPKKMDGPSNGSTARLRKTVALGWPRAKHVMARMIQGRFFR